MTELSDTHAACYSGDAAAVQRLLNTAPEEAWWEIDGWLPLLPAGPLGQVPPLCRLAAPVPAADSFDVRGCNAE